MQLYRDLILFLNKLEINNFKLLQMIRTNKLVDLINPSSLEGLDYLNTRDREKITGGWKDLDMDKYKNELYKNKIGYITIIDKNYPKLLLNTPEPPCVLYYKGDINILTRPSISLVGTRNPSDYGRWATKKLVKALSDLNITIVSGMAKGIDGIGHRQAIEANNKTIGVLASSLDIIYPKENHDLYRLMDKQLLVSEFPLSTQPYKVNFVRRNRIISGLTRGTIVIEAKERSGSLITAQYAAHQNREVFCLPGNVSSPTSKGTNDLIKKGAKLIDSIEDIMDEIIY